MSNRRPFRDAPEGGNLLSQRITGVRADEEAHVHPRPLSRPESKAHRRRLSHLASNAVTFPIVSAARHSDVDAQDTLVSLSSS